jgi:hypothetical protein
VIGLIVPSDAPVFVGGQAVHGVAASPFVHGQSISDHDNTLGTDVVRPLSCPSPASPRSGPCSQCYNARFHHLRGEYGLVHRLPNPIRISSPESNSKNLQKSNEMGSSGRGTTFLLVLHLPRLHEFGRGTTRWYDGHGISLVWLLTPSNSLHPSCECVSHVRRNYLEYVTIRLHNSFEGLTLSQCAYSIPTFVL